jgi:hypothetical protein
MRGRHSPVAMIASYISINGIICSDEPNADGSRNPNPIPTDFD